MSTVARLEDEIIQLKAENKELKEDIEIANDKEGILEAMVRNRQKDIEQLQQRIKELEANGYKRAVCEIKEWANATDYSDMTYGYLLAKLDSMIK